MILKETTLSPNNLTTVPPPVRNGLDLKMGDKIAWCLEDGRIVIKKGDGKKRQDHIFYVDRKQPVPKENNDHHYPTAKECIFCGSNENLVRAHMDYEDGRHNYITTCQKCHYWMDNKPVV